MARLRPFVMLLVLLLGMPSVFAAPAPSAPSPPPLEDVIARVRPAVVYLSVKGALGGSWSCSGFIYDPSGFVLTNHHCVDAAAEITVTLPDRRTFAGAVVDYMRRHEFGCPARTDVWIDAAVMKINGTNLPTIPLGESSALRQGQELYVLGYPQPSRVSPEEVSLSRGIVSAVRPGWIQTDAVIIGGNSGGPVVDRQGRVVGLAAFLAAFDPRGGSGFGGIVHIDAIRPMATAALTGGAKIQEFSVTGLEYVPPVAVGRRRVFRTSYEPGNTQTQARVTEDTSEVIQVQNFFGTFAYKVRTSDGSETQNILTIDGLQTLGSIGGPWRWTYQEPPTLLVFPPCVGYQWENRYRGENQSAGIVRQVVARVRIMADNDAVTVPAGTFPQTLRVVTTSQGVDARGGQQSQWQEVETEWWAPGVGAVRTVTENPATRQRWVSDLVSTGGVPAASPPPAPAPPQPAPPQPAPPSPTPPPPSEVVKPPAPNDRAIEPGDRVGAARIGDSLDSVIRILAEAPTVYSTQRPGQPGGWIGYQWKNRLYVVVDKDTRIIQRAGVWAPNRQEIAQPPFRVRGIGIGSGLFEVTAAFGQPDIRRQERDDVLYVYNTLGLAFYFGTNPQIVFNGQVWEIFVFKPGTYE